MCPDRLARRNRDLGLEPALATSWEQTSPTVWRFHLRSGVKWQDGSPFTADAILAAEAPGEGVLGATALGFYVLAFNLSSWPVGTSCSTSATVTLPAVAIIGLKFRAVFR